MKSRIQIGINLSCFLSVLSVCYAQQAKLKRAEKHYSNYAYIKAADVYKDVIDAGYESKELFQHLGNAYYFNANYQEAEQWYKRLFDLSKKLAPIYYLRYSQCLRAANNPESEKFYTVFIEMTNARGNNLSSVKDYLKKIKENSGRYSIENLKINSSGVDFGTAKLTDRQIVFTSTRATGTVFKRRHSWNNLPFMDLYVANLTENGIYDNPVKLKGKINTRHHESSPCFTNDGKTMYFTRSNTTSKIKDKTQHLKIYRATLINDSWTNVEDLSINADTYSNAHPVLNKNNTKLYFASDRQGGEGLTDIYVVTINKDGSMGQVNNMGNQINTDGRESFPFITKDDELYFSSDGHLGLGGYDVFYIDIKDQNKQLINVGEPVNSSFDDIAFSINNTTNNGFVSSNRTKGKGYDDIYSFIETIPIRSILETVLFGKITDKNSGYPLANTSINLLNRDNNLLATISTDSVGNYSTRVKRDYRYLVRAKKEGYGSDESYIETITKKNELNFVLGKEEVKVVTGDDIAKTLEIQNIYFDLDKYNIRPDAEVELQKIIAALKRYPDINIEVRSHTDSRANDAYNIKLSNNRAKSTVNYIVKNDISPNRLTSKGYGETQLVNHCANGVKCTKQKHQDNRRSEFIITGIETGENP